MLAMGHWRARGKLADWVDGALPEATALEVEVHAASCARCRRIVRELRLSEQLLMGVPGALLPIDSSPESYRRLVRLARWRETPEAPRWQRWPVPVFSLTTAAALVMVAVMSGRLAPDSGIGAFGTPYMGGFEVASLPQDSALIPQNYR